MKEILLASVLSLSIVGSGIAATSNKEDAGKGFSWLILLLGRGASESVTLLTPYVNESDMKEIGSVFNSDKNSPWPWSRIHDGFDIYPHGNLKLFQAACSGRVRWMYPGDEQVIVMLACNSTYTVEYNFESQAPGTGDDQLANIAVAVGQAVSQGDIIGSLYAPNDKAHVHFSLYRDWIPSCPATYFTGVATNSMLNLLHKRSPGANLCYGGDVTPYPLLTPYADKSDMTEIKAAFSSDNSSPPWGYVNDGIDIYPQGDLKPFQAACSGVVDSVDLRQAGPGSNWQVEVLINCDDYVDDPGNGGYFIPFSTDYVFEPMSANHANGLSQLGEITVNKGDVVSQGDTIGRLKVADPGAHVQFGVKMFAGSDFSAMGVTSIPICPEPHFSIAAGNSTLNLLHVAWPGAAMCYQN